MTRIPVGTPTRAEYGEFYHRYISLAGQDDIRSQLATQLIEIADLLASVAPDRETFRYAKDKWSVREVLGHITDAERVFGYRALSFGRGSDRPLPGFDEKVWALRSSAGDRRLSELFAEFELVRRGHIALFEHFPPDSWSLSGEANGQPVTVRALAFIMVGHAAHHLGVLRSRYGLGSSA